MQCYSCYFFLISILAIIRSYRIKIYKYDIFELCLNSSSFKENFISASILSFRGCMSYIIDVCYRFIYDPIPGIYLLVGLFPYALWNKV